jgi:hypothetical protein
LHRLALIVPLVILDACSGCGESNLSGRADAEADTSTEPDVEITEEPATDPLPEPVVDVTEIIEMDPVEEATDPGLELVGDCTTYEDAVFDTSHWVLTVGGSENEIPKDVITGHDGHIYVSATRFGGSPGQYLLLEIDAEGHVLGQTIWEDVIGNHAETSGQFHHSVTPLHDCGLLIASTTDEGAIGGLDVWLAKLDPGGTLLWQKALGGPGHDVNPSVVETRDGGILVAAMTESWARSYDTDLWLVKLDPAARIIWQECLGGFWDEYTFGSHKVVEAPDGTIFVTVNTRSFSGANDAWVVSLDPGGGILWQKSLGHGDIDDQLSAAALAFVDGYLYLAGSDAMTGATVDAAWIVKMRPAGSIVWSRSFGTDHSTQASSVIPRGDGGIIVSGTTRDESFEGIGYNAWVASLDPDGTIAWQKLIGEYQSVRSCFIARNLDGLVVTGEKDTSTSGPSPNDVMVSRFGLDGTFSGTCSWFRDADRVGPEMTTPMTITDIEPRVTDGVIVDAHSTFIDPDLTVTLRCPE